LEFGDKLVENFEPMLNEQQRAHFDELINQNSSQDEVLSFLTGSIENLEEKIMEVLMNYRQSYLESED
jgi:hypothetical protein